MNYDPGSPAGKEYAIPFVQGRSIGQGTTNQRAAANIPFGSGIKPPRGGAGAPVGHSGSGKGAGGSHRGSATGKSRGAGTSGGAANFRLSKRDQQRLLKAEEPGGTGFLTVGIALAVLLPALLVGILLRRRPEQPAS